MHEDIHVEVFIQAPPERVFEALIDPRQRTQWWGGNRFHATAVESDARPGGRWRMEFDFGGRPSSVGGFYRVIAPPRVLEFTWQPDWYPNPSETVVRFEMNARDGGAHVQLTHTGLRTEADRANHKGWPEMAGWLREFCEAGANPTTEARSA